MTGLTEDDNRRPAKTKHRLPVATAERRIQRMELNDATHGQRADLRESDPPEVLRFEDIDCPFVQDKDVRLGLQRIPCD